MLHTTQNIPAAPPALIIGDGPVALYAVIQAGRNGLRPVLITTGSAPETDVTASLRAQAGAELNDHPPLFLNNRIVTSVWGSLESGFNLETDTGETVTGAAVIFTHKAAGGVTGLEAITDYKTSETAQQGVFLLSDVDEAASIAVIEGHFSEASRTAVAAAQRIAEFDAALPSSPPAAGTAQRAAA